MFKQKGNITKFLSNAKIKYSNKSYKIFDVNLSKLIIFLLSLNNKITKNKKPKDKNGLIINFIEKNNSPKSPPAFYVQE